MEQQTLVCVRFGVANFSSRRCPKPTVVILRIG